MTKNLITVIETTRRDLKMLGTPSVCADMVHSANFAEQPTRKKKELRFAC